MQKLLMLCRQMGLAALLLSLASFTHADWHQWLGAQRNGISTETGLIKSWGQDGPNVIWRVQLGEGYSGISYAGGKLFTMFSDEESEYLACYNASDGAEVWRFRTDDCFTNDRGNGPRSTPTLDGNLVFVLGAKGKLHAIEAENGRPVWMHDLVDTFSSKVPSWGFASSPLVVDDYLIAEVGGNENRSLMAFNKQNGEVVWASHSDEAGYSSPVFTTIAGIPQVVHLTLKTLLAVAPDSGEVLWSYNWPEGINIATPLVLPNDRVFISCSYDKGSVLLQINKQGDKLVAEEVWKNRKMKNHFNPSISYKGYLYGFDNAIFKCMKAETGEDVWKKRGFGKGSVILADSMLVLLSDNGKLALIEATPAAYTEYATHQVLKDLCWTIPTLQEKRLYLRNQTEMVCLDLSP